MLAGEVTSPPPPATAPRPVSAVSGMDATAVILTRYGGPEVLAAQKVLVAIPGAGEARIRQTAIGVNFIDVYCRRGSFDLVTPPGVLGMEAAGVVESVGPGVTNVRPGDRVGYACAPPGSYASVRTMRTDLLVKLPAFLTDDAAASMLLKGITAGFLLARRLRRAAWRRRSCPCRGRRRRAASVPLGEGARRDCRSDPLPATAKAELAKRVGCDHVIISSREDIAGAVKQLTDGRGVQVVYDAIGKDTFEASINSLTPRGHLVSFGQASGDVGAYSIDKLASRSVTLSRPNYGHYTDTAAKLKLQTDRLFAALQARVLVAERPRTYALADAGAAHGDLEGRRTTGALVLIP